jgi:hypothetical protein
MRCYYEKSEVSLKEEGEEGIVLFTSIALDSLVLVALLHEILVAWPCIIGTLTEYLPLLLLFLTSCSSRWEM